MTILNRFKRAQQPKFKKGDLVHSLATGNYGEVIRSVWNPNAKEFFYSIKWQSGPNIGGTSPVYESGLRLTGAPNPTSSQLKVGDDAWMTRDIPLPPNQQGKALAAGEHVVIVSGPTGGGYGVRRDDGSVVTPVMGAYMTNKNPASGKSQPLFKEGDVVQDEDGDIGTVVGFGKNHGKTEYLIEFGARDGYNAFTSTRWEGELKKVKAPTNKFKPGDRVFGPGEHGQAYGTIIKVYDFADEPDNRYLVEFDGGYKREIYEEELTSANESQQTQQQQLDQRQNVDPESRSKQQFHPSLQDLMSHIKDTGTPYFPPTPEGQKAFEEFLIQQHNQEMEQMKRNWGQLAKKIGKVRADIIKKQQMHRLYTEAMKHLVKP